MIFQSDELSGLIIDWLQWWPVHISMQHFENVMSQLILRTNKEHKLVRRQNTHKLVYED